MHLDSWDTLTRNEQERTIGRDLVHGAPLSGTCETDPLDLQARDARGDLAIPLGAHARLAHPSQNAGIRIFRKGANFTEPGQARSAGLIFLSHQADVGAQFTPLQQRLDEMDDLDHSHRLGGVRTPAGLHRDDLARTESVGLTGPPDNADAGGSL